MFLLCLLKKWTSTSLSVRWRFLLMARETTLSVSPQLHWQRSQRLRVSDLGRDFTHGAIQYLWVSGAPGCIINRSLRGQCELITAVMMSVSDTQPYCWWNINEPGVISPHFHTHRPAFGAQIRQSGCELITARLTCVLSILMGDINLVWKQPFKKKKKFWWNGDVSQLGGRDYSISCQRLPLAHPS